MHQAGGYLPGLIDPYQGIHNHTDELGRHGDATEWGLGPKFFFSKSQ